MKFNEHLPMRILPDKSLYLLVVMYDEFETILKPEFGLRIEKNNIMVELDNYYTVNSKTRVFGAANQNVTLILSTPQQLFNIEYRVKVILLPCSPGFYYNLNMKQCSYSSDNKLYSYPAITKCDNVKSTAFVKRGYWVGYHPSHSCDEDNLKKTIQHSILRYSIIATVLVDCNRLLLSAVACLILCVEILEKELFVAHAKKVTRPISYHSRQTISCGKNRLSRLGVFSTSYQKFYLRQCFSQS